MPSVPNFPPISGVQDAVVRSALQAIIDNLRVRNGETKSGDAFITKNQLDASVIAALSNSSVRDSLLGKIMASSEMRTFREQSGEVQAAAPAYFPSVDVPFAFIDVGGWVSPNDNANPMAGYCSVTTLDKGWPILVMGVIGYVLTNAIPVRTMQMVTNVSGTIVANDDGQFQLGLNVTKESVSLPPEYPPAYGTINAGIIEAPPNATRPANSLLNSAKAFFRGDGLAIAPNWESAVNVPFFHIVVSDIAGVWKFGFMNEKAPSGYAQVGSYMCALSFPRAQR